MRNPERSPDDVKKGLACAGLHTCPDEKCPYYASCAPCELRVQDDDLALIQQLEKRVIHLEALNQSNLTTITMQERTRARLQERISQLEAERDALFEEVRRCSYCIYVDGVFGGCDEHCESCEADCPCRECAFYSKFEWRGVQKEDSDA